MLPINILNMYALPSLSSPCGAVLKHIALWEHLYRGIIIPHFTIQLCIRYRGIFKTIPLYLEFEINIFSIFWQVSGVKSKLVRLSHFLDIFWNYGRLKTELHSRDLGTLKCSHSALLVNTITSKPSALRLMNGQATLH